MCVFGIIYIKKKNWLSLDEKNIACIHCKVNFK